MEVPNSKKRYAKPELIAYGSIANITRGTQDGESLDATFPVGSLRSSLTFS
jgi:hypothetical protein